MTMIFSVSAREVNGSPVSIPYCDVASWLDSYWQQQKISGLLPITAGPVCTRTGKLAWPMGWSCWQACCNDMVCSFIRSG